MRYRPTDLPIALTGMLAANAVGAHLLFAVGFLLLVWGLISIFWWDAV